VEGADTGNYQTLINDALVEYIQRKSMLEAVAQVAREEFAGSNFSKGSADKPPLTRIRRAVPVVWTSHSFTETSRKRTRSNAGSG
jgi:hypothetical protein